jgi:flagellar biosynthetic protein FliP
LDFGSETAEGGMTGRIVQLMLMITALSLAPSLLIMVTCFTRMIVVLSLLRSAMGTASTPPNMVMVSLALFLTFFVMMPVFNTAWTDGVQPLMDGKIEEKEAFTKTVAPFRTFMLAHTREGDLRLFMELGKIEAPVKQAETPLHVLIPAFMISELHRAFEIGFLLFLPFLIIDMVIASVLMSMGMMMLPPVVISLPFKVIFFALVDGWYLVAGSLVRSYGG